MNNKVLLLSHGRVSFIGGESVFIRVIDRTNKRTPSERAGNIELIRVDNMDRLLSSH